MMKTILNVKMSMMFEFSYFLSMRDGDETEVAKYSFFVTMATMSFPLLSMKISYPVPCIVVKLECV